MSTSMRLALQLRLVEDCFTVYAADDGWLHALSEVGPGVVRF